MMTGDRRTRFSSFANRGIYLALALLMTAFAVGGFWGSYWGPLFAGNLDIHWLLHVHGVVFTAWLALLVFQVVLVYRGRSDLHEMMGKYVGITWGLLVLTIGLAAAFGRISPEMGNEFESLAAFVRTLPVPLGDLAAFGVLFGVAIAYRSRPATHKRLMILATAALLPAAGGRLSRLVDSTMLSRMLVAGSPLLFAGLAIGHEWWRQKRVHRAYLLGTGFLVAMESRFFFIDSDTWTSVSSDMAEGLRAVLQPLM